MMDRAESRPTIISIVSKIIVMIVCGFIFGLLLRKSKIYDPEFIRTQLIFQNGFLLKFFLSAIATSQLCLCFLTMVPSGILHTTNHFQKFLKVFLGRSILSSIIGGYILGIGAFLSGSFPSLEMVQIGAGIYSAVFTLFGMFLGLLLYEVIRSTVTSLLNQPDYCYKTILLHNCLCTPYFILAFPICASLSVVVGGIEVLKPWETELINFYSEIKPDDDWSPYGVGSLLGGLQVVLIISNIGLLCSHSHGSYSTVLSLILFTRKIQQFCPSLNKHRTGFHNWLQVLFVISIAIGSFYNKSDTIHSTTFHLHHNVIGGILLSVGTKLSGNCFMGHGITGMSLLALPSMVTITTAFMGIRSITWFMNYSPDEKLNPS